MSAMTDKAFDLIPTLKAAIVALDEALDNLAECEYDKSHPAFVFAQADAEDRADDVRIMLDRIERAIPEVA